jgi:hypothetical protein
MMENVEPLKKKIYKSILLILICIAMASFLSGCGDDDPLIGTWVEPNSGIFMTFDDNGKVLIGEQNTSYSMEYEKKDPNVLVIHVSTTGTAPDLTMNYQFNDENDKMTLIVNGVQTVFDKQK